MSGRKRWTPLDQMVGESLPPKSLPRQKDHFDDQRVADTVPSQGESNDDGTGQA